MPVGSSSDLEERCKQAALECGVDCSADERGVKSINEVLASQIEKVTLAHAIAFKHGCSDKAKIFRG